MGKIELILGLGALVYIVILEIRLGLLKRQLEDAKKEFLKAKIHNDVTDMSDSDLLHYLEPRTRKDS